MAQTATPKRLPKPLKWATPMKMEDGKPQFDPKAFESLHPFISGQIMRIHYLVHHQAYIDKFDDAKAAYSKLGAADTVKMIELQTDIKFHGGGDVNHALFWENLWPPTKEIASAEVKKRNAAPSSTGIKFSEPQGSFPADIYWANTKTLKTDLLPESPLEKAIKKDFGNLATMKAAVRDLGLKIQGSGWVWVVYHPKKEKMDIHTTKDQDPITHGAVILGIDVWEHAYYIDYQSNRGGYLDAIWSVINLEEANRRYLEALKLPK